MKKKNKYLCLCISIMILGCGIVGMASDTIVKVVTIQRGEATKTSPAVGASKSATFDSKNDCSSEDRLGVYVKAGWIGYPMTTEEIIYLNTGGCSGRSTMKVEVE